MKNKEIVIKWGQIHLFKSREEEKMERGVYEIMHKDRRVASVGLSGRCRIYYKSFLPYNLYLEEDRDLDTLVNNLTNFYYWCATRVLTLDRVYAKEILNSMGMQQAVTDRDRAKIALSYRCASLTDVFWVRMWGEKIGFDEMNLYENHLDNTFLDIALKGRQYTAENQSLSRDAATSGCFPKAWQRTGKGFRLLKDGGDQAVERELLASQICRSFDVNQVLYEEGSFEGEKVSVSENMTSWEYSIASMEAFAIYVQNHGRDVKTSVLKLDRHNYYMMNVVDYLVGNTDRHWGNWGVLVDNSNNRPVCLHKLMDFNQSFHAYDQMEGANCQTAFGEHMTQREAACRAVREVGLNQKEEIKKEIFSALPEYYGMFRARLGLLEEEASASQ